MDVNETFAYIDANGNRFVSELQAACRQPSVASQNLGMGDMAQLVADSMSATGIRSKVVPVTGGFPIVYGELEGETDRTILFYNHYDVQPPEPLAEWSSPPFAAEVRDGLLYARGAADNKGCLFSRIHALEAVLRTVGRVPVTVKFLVEGEEEIGSAHLKDFVLGNRSLLTADAYVWEYAAKDDYDNPTVCLGNKGMLGVELIVEGASHDLHSMLAPIYANAAWELVQALASLKNHEDVLIDGFYADIEPTTPEERELLGRIPGNETALMRTAGVDRLLHNMTGHEAIRKLYTAPTANICGIQSGEVGEGFKTILPARAVASLDFRLLMRQDPADILRKLRQHLDRHGFGHVRIGETTMLWPSKTPVTSPFVQIVRRTAAHAYGREIVVLPTSAASGPRHVFSEWTDAPIVALGVGYTGSRIHAPDENIRLTDYYEAVRHIAAIMLDYGREGRR
jgi:acetylornithine deacetylase/succinyl-diaminopimelate desuccinylase-like protein